MASPDRKSLRAFGLLLGATTVALFGLGLPWLLGQRPPWWPWLAAGALWLPALFAPRALRPVYRGWMRFGAAIGAVNARILLGVAFYLVVAPFGLIARLSGRDPLRRRPDRGASYRVPSRANPPKHMEHPF